MEMHTIFTILPLLFFSFTPTIVFSSPAFHPNPELVVHEVHRAINESVARRNLGYLSCGTGNPIDDCWRCDPDWENNRQRLADCAIGFGKNAIGGKNGRIYVVTDSSDNDVVNPKPGTLRHAVIQAEPLWIIFQRDMVIKLKEELIMNSFKTIDGRGASVHISGGPCITIQYVTNIIIHGINVHDCKQGGNAMVRSSPSHYGWRTISDGDGVSLFGASHVWVDHCSLSNCADGLIDAIMGSTAITISNNYLTHHDKVMLLGHSDSYSPDKNMQATIAFNHFGEGLVQRMPRCRHGYFHVVNNDYTHWEMYAIGGSASPTINSQGNRFLAPNDRFKKEVLKRIKALGSRKLSYGGRLALVKAVLSHIHDYWARIFILPTTIMRKLIAVCRNYLWCDNDQYTHSPAVSWERLCHSKKEGGLGIIDPIQWNMAAICKYVWWIASKQDHLWIKWVHCTYIKQQEWWGYSPPLNSSWAWRKVCAIKEKMKEGFVVSGSFQGQAYTVQNGYKWLTGEHPVMKWNAMVWNRINTPSHCFLAWMAMVKRLKTRDRLAKMHICVDEMCLLCDQHTETHEHLFFTCVFSTQCLQLVEQWLGIPLPLSNIENWWCARNKNMVQKKIGAAAVVSLIAHIWYVRNKCRVERYVIRPHEMVKRLKKELLIRIKYVLIDSGKSCNPWLYSIIV